MSELLKEIFGRGPSLSDRWGRIMQIFFHPSNEDRYIRAWIHGFTVLTMLIVAGFYFYNLSYWNGAINVVWALWNGIAARENLNAYRDWCQAVDDGEA